MTENTILKVDDEHIGPFIYTQVCLIQCPSPYMRLWHIPLSNGGAQSLMLPQNTNAH